MRFEDVTAVILTLDEAPNIGRSMGKLRSIGEIVVVDSGSTDETRAIAERVPGTRVVERKFTTHAEQWNYGLEQVRTEWALALDADYVLSDALIEEIAALGPSPDVSGYRASFVYCIDGRPLRSGAYPPVVVLFRRGAGRYEQDGHTQRVRLSGKILSLQSPIYHDDRKPLSRWLASQARYMELEAAKLRESKWSDLALADRVRRLIVVAPAAMFFYCLVVRGGLLDGRAGWFYAMQRAAAEVILSLYLLRDALTLRT